MPPTPRLPVRKWNNRIGEMHFGIIAAGEGSRLSEEGVREPKPLLGICGCPMIIRLARIFVREGAESVSVVVKESMPEVKEALEAFRSEVAVPVNVVSRTTPSSMHTFYELMRLIPGEGRFVATTVDTIFKEEDFHGYVERFSACADRYAGMMAVTDFIEDEKPLYVETTPEMDIKGFHDSPVAGCVYVSGGIYGLDGRARGVMKRCLEGGVARMRNFQRELIASGLELKACPMGKIIDVDHAGDIRLAEEFLGCR